MSLDIAILIFFIFERKDTHYKHFGGATVSLCFQEAFQLSVIYILFFNHFCLPKQHTYKAKPSDLVTKSTSKSLPSKITT